MFKVDHSKGESTFEQIKPGEYEAIVINYEQGIIHKEKYGCCGL